MEQKRFPDVDFSGLPEEWYAKAGHYNFLTNYSCPQGQQLLWERMRVATQWLCDRPEKSLIIVAHHTVFTFLVGMEFHNCEVCGVSMVFRKQFKLLEGVIDFTFL